MTAHFEVIITVSYSFVVVVFLLLFFCCCCCFVCAKHMCMVIVTLREIKLKLTNNYVVISSIEQGHSTVATDAMASPLFWQELKKVHSLLATIVTKLLKGNHTQGLSNLILFPTVL